MDRQFDATIARKDLHRFRRRGPDAVTRHLLTAVQRVQLAPGASLLDIGGGIGAIHHRLLDRGFARATQADASAAYLAAAAVEAERLGHRALVEFRHGDFRDLAGDLPAADAVTLDRVVCCDPDYRGLLAAAADHSRSCLALSYPRDRWYVRAVVAASNTWRRLWGRAFRAYVHSPVAMADVLLRAGLRRTWAGGTFVWAIELHERVR